MIVNLNHCRNHCQSLNHCQTKTRQSLFDYWNYDHQQVVGEVQTQRVVGNRGPLEYGMLVMKSSSVKMDLSTGQAPLFLKAEMIVDGQKDPSLTSMYSLMKSSFDISDPVSSTMESHQSSQAHWNGPKTPTSRGCNM